MNVLSAHFVSRSPLTDSVRSVTSVTTKLLKKPVSVCLPASRFYFLPQPTKCKLITQNTNHANIGGLIWMIFLPFPQVLRSFDQFSNMVLQHAIERKIHASHKDQVTYFADMPMTGLYVVRGDTIVLLGQVGDEGQEDNAMMKQVEMEEMEDMIKAAAAGAAGPIESNNTTTSRSDGQQQPPAILEWDFDKDLMA
jgi:hypothetical protein